MVSGLGILSESALLFGDDVVLIAFSHNAKVSTFNSEAKDF